MKKLARLVFLMILILSSVFYWNGLVPSAQAVPVGAQIGNKAPVFVLPNLDGQQISLEEFRGQKVFVNFWATWCPPCREEMPAIQEFVNLYGDQVQVIGISMGEDPKHVQNYLDEYGYSWLQLSDYTGSTASEDYLVRFVPTSLYIDEEGIIVNKYIGPLDLEMLKDFTQINY